MPLCCTLYTWFKISVERGQISFYEVPLVFNFGWEGEFFPQAVERFVNSESWAVCGKLDRDAARRLDIDGLEIMPVDDT